MENFVQLYKTAFIFSQEREYALYGMTCGKAKANTPQAGSITMGGHNVEKKSFEISVISEMLPLDIDGLLYRDEIKNKQGKEQRSIIYNYLKSTLLRDVPSSNEYKF